MDGTADHGLCCAVDPVGKAAETRMQALPVFDAAGDGERQCYRSEAGDVLVPHPAIYASGLDEAGLQAPAVRRKRTNIVVACLNRRRPTV